MNTTRADFDSALARFNAAVVRELLANFTAETIASVYSGVDGECCRGCAGEHRYASRFVDWASAHRGYAVTADEGDDAQVRIVLDTMLAAEPVELEFADDRTHVSRVVNGRLYIAYLASN